MKMLDPDWLLDADPRPVQIEALRRSYGGFAAHDEHGAPVVPWALEGLSFPARGWGHFLEMRLGKTPTLLNEYCLLRRDHGVNVAVVISPDSYKEAWAREAHKFGVPVPFMAMASKDQKDAEKFIADNPEGFGLVINYESARVKKMVEFLTTVLQLGKSLMAVDESIKIKNHESMQTKKIMQLGKEADYTRALSGRPSSQGPHDYYPQLRFCKALEGKNFYAFRNRYCDMGGFKNKAVKGTKNEVELKRIIDRHAFVAKRRDWTRVVEPDFSVDDITMTERQQELYTSMDKDFLVELLDSEVVTVDQVVTKLNKLQQISSGFIYDEQKRAHWLLPRAEDIPKVARVLEILEQTNSKAVVFCHFKPSFELLRKTLEPFGLSVMGSRALMNELGLDLEKEKEAFNNDPFKRVALASAEVVKYGHDLSGVAGDRCELKVFYENSYNLDTRMQAEMRNTANNQDWANLCIDLACSKIEKDTIRALIRKESLVEAVLGSYGIDRGKVTIV